jgi:hypothetical protein
MKELTSNEILGFLKQYMKDNGYSIVDMSRMLGIDYQVFFKTIKKDKVSYFTKKNRKKYIDLYNKVNNIKTEPVEIEEVQKKLSSKFEIISLETYDAITEALKNGEIIYKGNTSYFIDNDLGNILVKKVNDKVVALNPCINIDEVYYVKRRKKITISAGKCYRDSTGSVWFCSSKSDNVCYCIQSGTNSVFGFAEDGFCLESSTKLIEEV